MAEVLWNKVKAEAATLGQSKSFWEVSGISYDTRRINEGDLFIALPGKRDGHDFVKAAFDNGARWIVLCDTNGGTLPHEISKIVEEVTKHIPGKNLGIHAHNDTENAVANSLVAVQAGVRQVQGTINGLGERCGNANLMSLIPTFFLKKDFSEKYEINIKKLIPDDSLSINNGGIVPIGKKDNSWIHRQVELISKYYNFSLSDPIKKIPEEGLEFILRGGKKSFAINSKDLGVKRNYEIDYMGIESFIKDQLNNNESKNLRRWALQFVDIKKCKSCEFFKK